jgi:parallel beta-helix repeat protein
MQARSRARGATVILTVLATSAILLVTIGAAPASAAGVEVSVSDEASLEGDAGTSTLTFDVTLGAAAFGAVVVDYATGGGSAAAGTDYVAASGSVTFAPGELTKTVAVTINGDTDVEPNEWFFLDITSTDVPVADSRGGGSIVDDDGIPPDFVVDRGDVDSPDAAIDGVCAVTGGGCTLRAALAEADAAAGEDVIGFDLPAVGTPPIRQLLVMSALVANDTVVIDGSTQPGYVGSPVVYLNAAFSPTSPFLFLLRVNGAGSTVRGLSFGNDGSGYGLTLGGAGGHTVEGNWFSLDPTGMRARLASGIYVPVGSNGNQIGGRSEAARNVISAGMFDGLEVEGSNNVIEGNWIGLSATGTGFEGNARFGIAVYGLGNVIGGTEPGARNVLAANLTNILVMRYSGGIPNGGSGTVIQGNWVGFTKEGKAQPTKSGTGIELNRVSNLTVGGSAAGAGNVVSGMYTAIAMTTVSGDSTPVQSNQVVGNLLGPGPTGGPAQDVNGNPAGNQYGIQLEGANHTVGPGNVISANSVRGVVVGGVRPATDTVVKGNIIGLNATGTATIPGQFVGVEVSTGATGTRIGGTDPADRNIVSGNGMDGILLSQSSGTTIHGNYIGTDVTGTVVLGNGNGVEAFRTTDNMIGGTGAGQGNLIVGSVADAVRVYIVSPTPSPNLRNVIRGNTMHSNWFGIDLEDGNGAQGVNGSNTNDAGDADTGPNNLQNHPVLSAATASPSSLDLTVALGSEPNRNYTVDLYANTDCAANDHARAERYLGSVAVATDGAGNGTVTPSVAISSTVSHVTATAIDPTGNTSELAACIPVAVAPGPDAVDDTYEVVQDTELTVTAPGVLANDTDGTGDPLTASLTDGVDHGALELGVDGSLSFTPAAGFVGTDTFTYDASDGTEVESATVTVTVLADNDGDGVADRDDPDDDADSVDDDADNCPLVPNPSQLDRDGDGIGNMCDSDYTASVGDFDGDGLTDVGVFRPSVGGWYVQGQSTVFFGLDGDIPVPGDYDGDGVSERAVFRPAVGGWYIEGQTTVFFGLDGDVPVPGDYDGNGTTDIAVYRPAVGGWYVVGQAPTFHGLSTDVPVPGDYDGNGTTDIAVYRPSVGGWYVVGQAPTFHGLSTDVPVPGDYDGDGTTDVAVFRGDSGAWLVAGQATVYLGLSSDVAVPGDYDGDGMTDPAVVRSDVGAWFITGQPAIYHGLPGDIPTPQRPRVP